MDIGVRVVLQAITPTCLNAFQIIRTDGRLNRSASEKSEKHFFTLLPKELDILRYPLHIFFLLTNRQVAGSSNSHRQEQVMCWPAATRGKGHVSSVVGHRGGSGRRVPRVGIDLASFVAFHLARH